MKVKELITKLLDSFDLNEKVDIVWINNGDDIVFDGKMGVDNSGTIFIKGDFREDFENIFDEEEYEELFKN